LELWKDLTDTESVLLDPVCLAFDVSPARTSATISAAGKRGDGLAHVEVVEQREGTGWVVSRLKALIADHSVARVVCDARSPAAALLHDMDDIGLVPEPVSATDYGRACGLLVDTVNGRKLRHLGTSELRQAIKGAKARELGDAFAWGRKKSAIDITPLVSVTLALWGAEALDPGPASWSFG